LSNPSLVLAHRPINSDSEDEFDSVIQTPKDARHKGLGLPYSTPRSGDSEEEPPMMNRSLPLQHLFDGIGLKPQPKPSMHEFLAMAMSQKLPPFGMPNVETLNQMTALLTGRREMKRPTNEKPEEDTQKRPKKPDAFLLHNLIKSTDEESDKSGSEKSEEVDVTDEEAGSKPTNSGSWESLSPRDMTLNS
ncbi:hypothetical protein Ciccas_010845, partial [Cichlidogyrus casuarinus]